MKKTIIALILACSVFVVWYFGSPQWTLSQMQSAAENNDTERLATYIDFPALRESVKSEAKAQITAKMMATNNGFEAFGGFVAMGMIDGMVDAMVNPAMMRNAFAKKAADLQNGGVPFAIQAEGAEYVRDSIDQFRLRHTGRADLVFERRGLGWKLVGIRAPADGAGDSSGATVAAVDDSPSTRPDPAIAPADQATASSDNQDSKDQSEAFAEPCVGHYLNQNADPAMSSYSIDVTNRPLEVEILFSDYGSIKSVQEQVTELGRFEFTDYDDDTRYYASCFGDKIVIASKSQRLTAVKTDKQLQMSPDGE